MGSSARRDGGRLWPVGMVDSGDGAYPRCVVGSCHFGLDGSTRRPVMACQQSRSVLLRSRLLEQWLPPGRLRTHFRRHMRRIMSDSERGRRRGTERRRMTEMVAVRLAPAEKKSLEEAAARMGVSIARRVRESINVHIAVGDVKAPPD
jgi:hypothetical protein